MHLTAGGQMKLKDVLNSGLSQIRDQLKIEKYHYLIENKNFNIKNYKLGDMTNRWGNNGTVTDYIFLVSKITVDGDCSHGIKRGCSLEEKQ